MPRGTGLEVKLIPANQVKRVKVVSNGRIYAHEILDVSHLEFEDDGTYTVVVEK